MDMCTCGGIKLHNFLNTSTNVSIHNRIKNKKLAKLYPIYIQQISTTGFTFALSEMQTIFFFISTSSLLIENHLLSTKIIKLNFVSSFPVYTAMQISCANVGHITCFQRD